MKDEERANPVKVRGADDTDAGTKLSPAAAHTDQQGPTRRKVLQRSGRLLMYSAPMIHLFRPTEALAATGASPVS
ncbi:MAG: hypothetical protein V3W34_15575 [Phycisphaerae bacterium]